MSKRLRRLLSSSPTRRLRLAVRTQPSHGWCTGSIPVGVAIFCLGRTGAKTLFPYTEYGFSPVALAQTSGQKFAQKTRWRDENRAHLREPRYVSASRSLSRAGCQNGAREIHLAWSFVESRFTRRGNGEKKIRCGNGYPPPFEIETRIENLGRAAAPPGADLCGIAAIGSSRDAASRLKFGLCETMTLL